MSESVYEILRETVDTLGERFRTFKSENEALVKRTIEEAIREERECRENLERRFNQARFSGLPVSDGISGTTESRRALGNGIRSLLAGDQAKADRHFAEYKGMVVGVDADGGYFSPPELVTSMTRVMLETGPFLDLPRTVELRHGDRFTEVVDRNTAGAVWAGETTGRSDTSTPQIGQLDIPLREIYAMPKLSQTLIDTANVDVVGWLAEKVGESFAHAEVEAFLSGDGVSTPRGLLTYPTAATGDASRPWGTLEHVVTGANGAFKAANSDPADCLVQLVGKLKRQYRSNAVFVMNRPTEALVRTIKDTVGRFLLTDSLTADTPPRLLGYPLIVCEQMPDPSTGSLSIAFGDFRKAYTVVRRSGVKLLVDPYTDKPNVRLYTYKRVGGDLANSEAVKLLKFSA